MTQPESAYLASIIDKEGLFNITTTGTRKVSNNWNFKRKSHHIQVVSKQLDG